MKQMEDEVLCCHSNTEFAADDTSSDFNYFLESFFLKSERETMLLGVHVANIVPICGLIWCAFVVHGCEILDNGRELKCFFDEVKVTADEAQLVHRVVFHGSHLNWGALLTQFPFLQEWQCRLASVECDGDVPLDARAACKCSVDPITESPLLTPSTTTFRPISGYSSPRIKSSPTTVADLDHTTLAPKTSSSAPVCTTMRVDCQASLSWECALTLVGGGPNMARLITVGVVQLAVSIYGLGNLFWLGVKWIFAVSLNSIE